MASGNTVASADADLKELYTDEKMDNCIVQDNPELAMLPKKEDATGREYVVPLMVDSGGSRSATFSNAQTMSLLAGDLFSAFKSTLVENHAVMTIENKLIDETSNDEGSFTRIMAAVMENGIASMTTDIAQSLYRTSDGARGQIDSSTNLSSNVIVLKNSSDALLFDIGMSLDLAAAQSTGSTKAYGSGAHGLYVTGVDFNKGTVSVGTTPVAGGSACNITDATNGCPTAATGDYIYVSGDRNKKFQGFTSWIPFGGPLAGDSFNGVDRTIHPTRLAGCWLDASTGGGLIPALEQASSLVTAQKGKLTDFLVCPKDYFRLNLELGGKVQIMNETIAKVGFSGISVVGAQVEPIKVTPSRNVPAGTIMGINRSVWEIASVKKVVRVDDVDGNTWLRQNNASGVELRLRSFGNLVCHSPRQNVNIKVPV